MGRKPLHVRSFFTFDDQLVTVLRLCDEPLSFFFFFWFLCVPQNRKQKYMTVSSLAPGTGIHPLCMFDGNVNSFSPTLLEHNRGLISIS